MGGGSSKYFVEFLHVVGLGDVDALFDQVALLLLVVHEIAFDELLEFHFHSMHVYVGAPNHELRLTRRLGRHQRVRVRGCRHDFYLFIYSFLLLFLFKT